MTVAARSRIKVQSLPRTDSVSPTLHRVAKWSFPAKPPAVAEPQPRHTRLAVALWISLLAHTALMFRLGEPLPLPPPEIPPRILLNLTEAPPAPVIEPPPPPPKPKLLPVKPRPRSEAKRPDPKPTRPPVAQPPPPRSSPPAAVVNTPPAPVQPRPLLPSAEPVHEQPPLILNPD